MSQKPLTRVYVPYYAWEETYTRMWAGSSNRERDFSEAVRFTGNHKLYGKWMLKVVDSWPVSCVHNLTCRGMNRQAWIGHAACALAKDLPEDIVRQAWRALTEEQKRLANLKADKAIEYFENKYMGGSWQKSIWE